MIAIIAYQLVVLLVYWVVRFLRPRLQAYGFRIRMPVNIFRMAGQPVAEQPDAEQPAEQPALPTPAVQEIAPNFLINLNDNVDEAVEPGPPVAPAAPRGAEAYVNFRGFQLGVRNPIPRSCKK